MNERGLTRSPAVKCVFLCELFVFLASVKGTGSRLRYQGYFFFFFSFLFLSFSEMFIFHNVSDSVKKQINKSISSPGVAYGVVFGVSYITYLHKACQQFPK